MSGNINVNYTCTKLSLDNNNGNNINYILTSSYELTTSASFASRIDVLEKIIGNVKPTFSARPYPLE